MRTTLPSERRSGVRFTEPTHDDVQDARCQRISNHNSFDRCQLVPSRGRHAAVDAATGGESRSSFVTGFAAGDFTARRHLRACPWTAVPYAQSGVNIRSWPPRCQAFFVRGAGRSERPPNLEREPLVAASWRGRVAAIRLQPLDRVAGFHGPARLRGPQPEPAGERVPHVLVGPRALVAI